MGSMSDYLETNMRTLVFRTGAGFAKTATLAVCLCTTTPTASSTGATIVEPPSGNGYSRQTLNPLDANWNTSGSAGAEVTANQAILTFGPVTGSDWAQVTSFAICDSATYGAGNMLFWGTFTTAKTAQVGDTVTIAVGALTVTFT